MKINNRILLFFILPILAPLILPPELLISGLRPVLGLIVLFIVTGYLLYRNNILALTFMIFLQGLNFVVKLMLFFSNTLNAQGLANWPFAITSLLSMALSFYLIFRLDRSDIRSQMRT